MIQFDKIVQINNLQKHSIINNSQSIQVYNYLSDTIDSYYAKYLKLTNKVFESISYNHIYYFIILYKAIEFIQNKNYNKVLFKSQYFSDIILTKEEMNDILNFINIQKYINNINFKTIEQKYEQDKTLYVSQYDQQPFKLSDPIKPIEMNIFIAITTNVIKNIYPLLYSLLKYSESKFNVYIMLDVEKVQQQHYIPFKYFQTERMKITLLDWSLLIKNFNQKNYHYGSLMTFARVLIPTLLPQLDRILYLDYDALIVNKGIEYLYNINFNDKYFACINQIVYQLNPKYYDWCRETAIYKNFKKRYFSAGIMMFNISKIIEDKKDELLMYSITHHFTISNTPPLLKYYRQKNNYNMSHTNGRTFTFNDQSYLNYLITDDDITIFNPIFNSLNEPLFNMNNMSFNEYVQKWGFKDYKQFEKNIIIYHYIGIKPWDPYMSVLSKKIFKNSLRIKAERFNKIKEETDQYLKGFES